MSLWHLSVLAVLVLTTNSLNAQQLSGSETPIAVVEGTYVDAITELAGTETRQLNICDLVSLGETLSTDEDGSLNIRFSDGAMLSLGPDSTAVLDEFIYLPATTDNLMQVSVLRGSARLVAGDVSYGSMTVVTPHMSITAIRGEIVIEVDGDRSVLGVRGPMPGILTSSAMVWVDDQELQVGSEQTVISMLNDGDFDVMNGLSMFDEGAVYPEWHRCGGDGLVLF